MIDLEKCLSCSRLVLKGQTITLTVAEYEKLVREASSGRTVRSISNYRALSRSGIGLNPELAEFILEKAETMTIAGIYGACVERFGAKAPSRSSVFRFIDKMRKGARPG